ncbi:MAG: NAD-dependent succinate-semialdehyde dehydrogenase [Nanoarchaeota archaeon]|nr:NAD-dependent succinate-semialdehyde dehydrogenase [Nanoarchaeota archaeon]
MQSINPYTSELLREYPEHSFEQALDAVKDARKAQVAWSALPIHERCKLLRKAGEILRKRKDELATIITLEMGKPIKESVAEIEKCAVSCDYYASNAEHMLKPEEIKTDMQKSYVLFQPLGVVFAIMPWNFPFHQVFRCAAPALAAGNVCVLKHASNVPGSAMAIQSVFEEAGFPQNTFKTLLITSENAMKLVEHIDGVALTGSNAAGEAVGELAGKHIKKMVLELGGSDPFIVLKDANVEKAAQAAVKSRFLNAGQSCIAAKRFIVLESVAEAFEEAFVSHLKRLVIGDPMEKTTDIGPLAKPSFVKDLEVQLEDAKKKGAKVLYAHEKPKNGFFFAPCAVSNVTKDMKIIKEEVFGPIAPIIVVKTDEEAVRVANDTPFGLGASVWSKDLERAQKLAEKIQAGTVAINEMVKSDARMPFGGIKKSGVGREFSHYGLKEFVNVKTINMNP